MNLPPPMPDWTDLISRTPAREEVIVVLKADLPCNRCGSNHRVVYKSGKVDAYCRACRKEVNQRSYNARNKRDIKIGGIGELHTPGAPGGMLLRKTSKNDIAETAH